MVSIIFALFSYIDVHEVTPTEWEAALQCPAYKGKGSPPDCGNYRLITLLSAIAKLLEIVISRRVEAHERVHPNLDINQGGFQRDRGVSFMQYILLELVGARCHYRVKAPADPRRGSPVGRGGPTYCCFIDFKKAFPSVYKQGLWVLLHKYGIQGKLWRIMHSMLAKTSSRVRAGGGTSEPYEAEHGVREGSVLSPVLFLIFINELLTVLRASGIGARWAGLWLAALLYADDVVLIADS